MGVHDVGNQTVIGILPWGRRIFMRVLLEYPERRELFSDILDWLAYGGRMEFLVAGWFSYCLPVIANTAVS